MGDEGIFPVNSYSGGIVFFNWARREVYLQVEKIKWSSRLDRAIVKAIKAPIDLLLNSEEEVSQKQELPGHIIRLAVKEGIVL